MTITEAKKHLEDAVEYGYNTPEEFAGMTEQELIEWVEYNGAKGDYLAQVNE